MTLLTNLPDFEQTKRRSKMSYNSYSVPQPYTNDSIA